MRVSYDRSKWIFFHRESKIKPEPVFLKCMKPRNRFRGIDSASLCTVAGRAGTTNMVVLPACQAGIDSWAPEKVYKYGAQFKFIHFRGFNQRSFSFLELRCVSASQNIGCTCPHLHSFILEMSEEWRGFCQPLH